MPEEKKVTLSELEAATRKVVHSGEAPRYYTNNTEVAMTSYDLHLKFAIVESADATTINVKDQAIISMSLHHAKALLGLLYAYVAQFEKQHGPLSVPGIEDVEIPHETVAIKADSNA
ncbi:MAG TPA: DUF3467 domain-containing protein [Pyrinomonadaceae bacterium]|jgi:hypothetical protein